MGSTLLVRVNNDPSTRNADPNLNFQMYSRYDDHYNDTDLFVHAPALFLTGYERRMTNEEVEACM